MKDSRFQPGWSAQGCKFSSALLALAWGALVLFAVPARAQDFSISTLTPNNAVVVDVNSLVGDDRGGLAVSGSQVFLTGDAATARFNRDTLGGGTSLGVVRDGLVANLATSTVYLLGNASSNALASGGGTFATLIELNGSTGAPSGNVLALSTPITLTGSSASVGIFSGWNRIVVHTGTRAYRVSLPDGTVTDLGAMGVPTRTASESWAYWGVAENVGSDTYIVYVRNSTTISRTKVPGGPTTTVATFANLNDMASFTVSVAQNRWYFHHESSSQFGAFSESLGYADATFVSAPVAPAIAAQPTAVSVIAGEPAAFAVTANGTAPLAYQWLKNGAVIGGATAGSYSIPAATLGDAGSYSVVITNASGSVTSSVAALTVSAIDADLFKIVRLTASNAVVMDPILAAGDDRGGLVVTDERVFLRGDDSVGGFDLGLSGGVRLGTNNGANTNFFQYDSLVSDLRAQKAYVLADGTGALGVGGGTVTRLVEIHGSNGVPTGAVITLGTPIAMPGAGLYTANVGIFSGWGRIVLHNGTNAYSINLANGAVTDLGAMARPTRAVSESWAYWGVAEYFGGSHYLVYARDAQSIVRTRIPDGATTVISTFSNLNDLASFTVVPGLNRWYFHNETVNQFTNYANFGGEILGHADAAFIYQPAGMVTLTLATNSVAVLEDSGGYVQNGFVTTAPGGTVSYALVSDNAGLFAAAPALSPAGVLTFTSSANANGAASVTVTALNGSGQPVGSGSFIITVTAVNDAPVIALATNNLVVLEDGGAQTNLAFAAFSPGPASESAQAVLAVTVTNDNSALFSVPPAISAAGTLTFTPAANVFGSATVTVFVQDNGGTLNGGVDTSAAQSFTITVSAVNDAPVVLFSTNGVVVLEDSGAASVNGFASFSPGPANEAAQSLTGYTVANNNGALFSAPPAIAANGTLAFTPAPNANGSATVTVIAQDSGGTTGGGVDRTTNTFTLTVTAVNDAPGVALATNNVVVLEDSGTASLAGFATFSTGPANEAGQSITNVVTSNSNPALFSVAPVLALDGTLTFTPATNANGNATVMVIAQDNGGTASGGVNAVTNAFTISVAPVNDRPVIAVAGNVTLLEDNGAFSSNSFVTVISLGSTDEAGQAVTNYSVSSTNAALFGVAPAVDAAGTLTFTLAPNASGTALVTVTAQDNGGAASGGQDTSVGVSFLITVLAVNDQPGIAFTTNNVVVLEDGGAQTNLAFAAFSPGPASEPGQAVTNVTTSNDNSVLFAFQPAVGTNGTLTFTPAANANGSATVTVVAQDDGGTAGGGVDRATNTFTITITAVNDAPSVTFGTNNVVVLEDSGAASMSGFAGFSPGPVDEVGQTLAGYTVANSNPALFSASPALAPDGTLTFTPAANVSGSATVAVIAQDSGGTANGGVDRATNSFTITVNAVNDAPTVVLSTDNVVVLEDGGAQTNLAFATFLTGLADESAQTITNVIIRAVTNSALFSTGPVIGTDGTLFFTPAANANGTAQVTFAVQDNGGTASGGLDASASVSFLITVQPVNDTPSITFITNTVVVLEDSGTTGITGFASFSPGPVDETGQGITNVTVSASHPALFNVPPALGTNGTLIFAPAANANGSSTVTITVQDDGGTASGGVDRTTNSFTITVTPVNDAPVITLATNLVVVLEDTGVVLPGFASATPGPTNEAGQTLTGYTVTTDKPALFYDFPEVSGYGRLYFATATNASGTATVSVAVFDIGGTLNGGVQAATNTFTVVVVPVNDPPVVTFSSNNIAVLEDSGAASFTGFAAFTPGPSDEASQGITNVSVSASAPALFSVPPSLGTNGTLTFTPAANASGFATVAVVVQDDGGTASGGVDRTTNTFTISIGAVNAPPVVLFSTNNVIVLEDSGAAGLAAFATFSPGPANETGQNVTNVTVSSDNPALFSAPPALGLDGALAFTPATNANGSATVTVIAQDNGGTANGAMDKATNSFTITVTAVNDAPAFGLGGFPSSSRRLIGWGQDNYGQIAALATLTNLVAVENKWAHAVGLKSDGIVVATGNNDQGQLNIPSGLAGVIGVAAGFFHSMALKDDGTVVAWGENIYGQSTVPAAVQGRAVAISAGVQHSLALRSDGIVVAWGLNVHGQINVPASLSNAVAIAAGGYHSLALRANGTVVAWGNNSRGQAVVPEAATNVIAISAGGNRSMALRGDGTIVAWGDDQYGQTTVPVGLSNVTAIAAGSLHSLALRSDGTVTVWGDNMYGELAVPAGLSNVVGIAVGHGASMAFVSTNTNVIVVTEDRGAFSQAGVAISPSPGPANESGQSVSFLTANNNAALFSVPPAIAANGTLTFTPASNANGTATVTVRAQDDGGTANGGVDTSAPQTFTITITPVNDPPVVTLATNTIVVLEDSGPASRAGFAAFSPGPVDEAGQTLVSYTVTADNPAIFSVQPAISTSGTLTFTPAPNAWEGATVTVIAQDSGGTANGGVNRTTNTFGISVLPVNDPPQVVLATNLVVVPPDSGAYSNGAFAVFSAGPASDLWQSVTNVTVLDVSNPSLFTILPVLTPGGPPPIAAGGTLTFTLAAGAAGSATVSFVAQDNGGTSNGGVDRATNSFTIAVAAANVAPVVTFSTNLVAVLEDSGAVSRPGFASFSPGPVVEAGQLLLGYTLANNNSALFSVQPAINNAGTLTFTPATNANGSATVTVIAQDNGGTANGGVDRVTNTFQLTVTAVNDAPGFVVSNRLVTASVVAWGYNSAGATNVPAGLTGVVALAGGGEHSLALLATGTVTGWGLNASNQTTIPAGLTGVTAISAGTYHSMALKADGTVVAWGANHRGQASVPAGLTGVVAISAGGDHSVALKADGTVVAWGYNFYGESAVPAGLAGVTAIAAGDNHTAALKSDGAIVVWGFGGNGEKNVPASATNVAAITCGGHHVMALKRDGTVLAWGYNTVGQTNVPSGLSDVIAIAGGLGHSAALKGDGTVVVWGANNVGQRNVPANLPPVSSLACGGSHTVVLTGDTPSRITVAEDSGTYSQANFATNIVCGPANESGQTVTFLVSNDNGGLFSVPPAMSLDGTLMFVPAANAVGFATVTVRAQDDGGTANGGVDTSAARTFTIAVAAVNDPPTVTFSPASVTVSEDSGPASLAGFASFASGPANESGQTVVFVVSNNAPGLFTVQPALGTNGMLTFTPATNAVGTATITVIAQDSGGTAGGGVDRVTNTFVLTVAPVNDPPRVTFATDPVVAVPDGGPTNFPGFATFTGGPVDEAGQAVAVVSVVSDNPALFAAGGQPALSGAGELTFEPAAGAAGSALITVVTEDDGGTANGGQERATNSFTIMVTATRVFLGPLADAVPNGTLAVPVRLAGTGVEGGVAFTLNYNPGLFSLANVTLGGGAAGATLLTNTAQSAFYGRLGVLVMLPAGSTFPAGASEVAVVTLNVSASAPATNSPLTFGDTPVRREVTDISAVPLTNVAFVGGTARVLAPLPVVEGDVSPRSTGNGLVTVSDVVQVGRFAAGLDTFPIFGGTAEFQRADCAPLATQGDGRVSLADWVQAARFAAGLDTPGAPGGPTVQAAALRTTTASPASGRMVRVVSGSLVAGRANTMTVQLDALGNEAGVSLSLNFDPTALVFVRAATGSGAPGGSLIVNSMKAAAGKVGFVLVMPAGASIAAGTQDVITLTFNGSGSGSVVVGMGDTPVAREVADVSGNVLGMGAQFEMFVGGTFNLSLPAGLKAAGMERAADGSLRLVVRNSDGTPVTAAQAAKFEVHVTSHLGGAWTVLPNALVVENGALKIVDPAASAAGLRLYKLVETP